MGLSAHTGAGSTKSPRGNGTRIMTVYAGSGASWAAISESAGGFGDVVDRG